MPSLAKSPLAPILGQRVPLRGPARMLFRSYARTCYQPGRCVERLTTESGDLFDADLSSFLEWHLCGPPVRGGNYLAVTRSRAARLNALVA
jgi:hypothetical protein